MRNHGKYKAHKAAYYQRKKAEGVIYPSEAKKKLARKVVCVVCDSVSFLSKKSKYCGPVCAKNGKKILRRIVESTDDFKRRAKARRIFEGRTLQVVRERNYRARARASGRWNEIVRIRRKQPKNKLRKSLSRAIRTHVGTGCGSPRTELLTGCSMEKLVKHIESTFTSGMTWANYGTYWHIDHIIPCASWDMDDDKQRALAFHWTNLQALRAEENIRKGDKITNPQMSLLIPA